MRVTLRVVYESRDTNALLALAREGVCTAVLADEMLDEDDARRSRRVVAARRKLGAPLWLAWRPDDALSPAARALRDVMPRRASERAKRVRPGRERRARGRSTKRA